MDSKVSLVVDFSHLSMPALFITSVFAGAVAAVSGFGIGSLVTPLLLLWYPAHWAVALVAIPHAIASVLRGFRLRREVDRRVFVQFGIASAAGGLLGALLQSSLRSVLLTIVLAVLMLVAGATEIVRRPIRLPQSRSARLIAGSLSGFFGGLVGNQGGIRSAALL
ncbi:MAG TPA: sulfite exporter TauE/SafE family protein, partial [Gemmatimonadales bacterium]|nr:sulfite exporter TauE/SafE family protein [Gemmatimonadales bacterium]